jgi:uncharacterized protein
VRNALAATPIELSFHLITNGYFLTPELVDELVEYGLVSAQVTLDGDETTHSLTRVSKRGEDTFQKIFDHVIAASRRIKVRVNGNYQDNTVDGFIPLIGKLAAAGLPPNSELSFTPALEGLSSKRDVGSGAGTWSGSHTEHHVAIQDEILRHGFSARGAMHVVGPCEFHDHNSFAIDHDGTLHKCPGFLGHPEWSIGNVATGLTARYGQMLAARPQRECGSCSHRPNCGGGCIANEWLRAGRMDGVSCELGFFERVQRQSLVRELSKITGEPIPDSVQLQTSPSARRQTRGQRSPALRVLAA